MSTPLELAQYIASEKWKEFDGSVAFNAVKRIATALIEAAKEIDQLKAKLESVGSAYSHASDVLNRGGYIDVD